MGCVASSEDTSKQTENKKEKSDSDKPTNADDELDSPHAPSPPPKPNPEPAPIERELAQENKVRKVAVFWALINAWKLYHWYHG